MGSVCILEQMTKVICSIVLTGTGDKLNLFEVSQWERIFTKQQNRRAKKACSMKWFYSKEDKGCVFVLEGANKEPFTYTHVLYCTALLMNACF